MESLFLDIAGIIMEWLQSFGLSAAWADLVLLVIQFACIAGIVTLNVIILIWLERKVSGFIQLRLGPNRLGPWGAVSDHS